MHKANKPLSPARARELRGRRLKRWFGSLRSRTERWHRLVKGYGEAEATRLSAKTLVVSGQG